MTTTSTTPLLRPELEPLPERMRNLPVDERGYVVPRFVLWIGGKPDFRIMDPDHWTRCVKERACWVCGGRLGVYMTFVAGPMCGGNRTSSEPPCHKECALWSARNCPFMARPHMIRREDDLTALACPIGGVSIKRNPGVALLWTTRSYKIWFDDNERPLVEMGEPEAVEFFTEGRPSLREEVEESVRTGLPYLEKMAEGDPEALADLQKKLKTFEGLCPWNR